MKLKYFGTAAAEAWPGLFCSCDNCRRAKEAGGKNIRTRSQALINEDLLIDFPADTYLHVLKDGLDLTIVKDIIITHNHADHFYPEDFHMIPPPFAHNKDKQPRDFAINVHGNEAVNSVAPQFENKKEFILFNTIYAFTPVNIGKYIVTPLKADHDRLQNCFIYIIQDSEKKMLYGNDTGYFPEETWEYLKENHTANKKFDFISLDTTSVVEECRHGHMGLACVIEVKDRLIEIGSADNATVFCLHHFSHNGNKIHDELVPIAKDAGFIVSYDGMEVEI